VKVKLADGCAVLENKVLQQTMPPVSVSLLDWWLRGWSTVFQSLMFRRDFVERCGRYRTDMWAVDDSEFFSRMLVQNPKTAFTDACLTLYRLHSVNKITQNEGRPEAGRIVDWAIYLSLVSEVVWKVAPRPNLLTRIMFRASTANHLTYLRKVTDAPAEVVASLERCVAGSPKSLLAAVQFCRRVAGHFRQRLCGTRSFRPYRVAALTDRQRELIQQAGYHVEVRAA
jgi:hypothetical protein